MDMTKELLLETADLICSKTFIFNHKWDMEVCKTPVKFENEIVWNKIPFNDEEWVFMLNRHKFWTFLAKAYHLTKNKKYLNAFIEQINSWIDNVDIKNPEFKDCSRTIEMGLRCINWIKTLEIFEKDYKFDENLKNKIYSSLKEQCDILIEIYDDFRILSNWGVLQNCGLIAFSFYFNLTDTDYFKIPLERLEHQCKIQILPDGIHWEQSPMYQNEVLNCLLETAVHFKRNNIEIPSFIKETIKKIGMSNIAMKKPNHHQPMQGDSDDTDLRDIITRCAAVLEDGKLKFGGFSEIDFESIWELDEKSLKNYSKIQTEEPKNFSAALKESGNFYLRDSFKENGNYLWFSCGPIGSGHGHAELLHFDLTYNGENFFIDSGRYTYVEGEPKRIELKNCCSHNTTTIDNKFFTEFSGSWGIVKTPLILNSYYDFTKKYDYVAGGHLGYTDLSDPVIPFRKIFYLKPDLWIITDEFNAGNTHTFKQFFNFDTNINIFFENNYAVLNGKNTLYMKWSDEIKKEIKDIFISKEYNKLESSKRIETEGEFNKSYSVFTIISPKNIEIEKIQVRRGDNSLVDENEIKAIKVKFSKDEEIIFFNAMKEITAQKKTYMIENILFYGKTGFIEIKNNIKTLKVIKY